MRRTRLLLLTAGTFLLLLTALSAAAQTDLPAERWYTERWCALKRGEMWVRMVDGGRCDCVTPTHAVEVSVAAEWADAVGWALRSALNTGKRAGIVLIVEGAADDVYRGQLDAVIDRYNLPIRVWSTSRGIKPAK